MTATAETALDAAGALDALRATFRSGRTRDLAWRTAQLEAIERMCAEPETEFATRSKETAGRVTREISCGATVVNHLMFHVLVPQLPFGGVGRSGRGAYHGRFGFETFSHRRSVLVESTRPDPGFVYPPYGAVAERLLRKLF